MVVTVLLFLFIGQVLSFYFIILLYTKISRLKDMEISQERLKDEMDNAVGAYLAEMRDENNRLIKELTMIKQKEEKDLSQPRSKSEEISQQLPREEVTVPTLNMPRNVVAKAYLHNSSIKSGSTIQDDIPNKEKTEIVDSERTLTIEEQVQELYRNGKSIEDIAKTLQKGKTEIELLLKFQH